MIVQFLDRVAGAAVYINPEYVVMMRPDPEHPLEATIVKLNDGETLTVIGDHREVADKLRPVLEVAGR
jgi:hypothetical protein